MTKTIDLKKLIGKNPKVNIQQLEEILRTLKELHRRGVKHSEYELTPPFSRNILAPTEEEPMDARSVYLRPSEESMLR